MQDNIQIIAYKQFVYHGQNFKNVLRFHFKGGNSHQWSLYMLPGKDGQGYSTLQGQGHIRGSVLKGIKEDFGDEKFNDFAAIYARYSAAQDAIIEDVGVYR